MIGNIGKTRKNGFSQKLLKLYFFYVPIKKKIFAGNSKWLINFSNHPNKTLFKIVMKSMGYP